MAGEGHGETLSNEAKSQIIGELSRIRTVQQKNVFATIAERLGLPVMVRLVTRLAHSRSAIQVRDEPVTAPGLGSGRGSSPRVASPRRDPPKRPTLPAGTARRGRRSARGRTAPFSPSRGMTVTSSSAAGSRKPVARPRAASRAGTGRSGNLLFHSKA